MCLPPWGWGEQPERIQGGPTLSVQSDTSWGAANLLSPTLDSALIEQERR